MYVVSFTQQLLENFRIEKKKSTRGLSFFKNTSAT